MDIKLKNKYIKVKGKTKHNQRESATSTTVISASTIKLRVEGVGWGGDQRRNVCDAVT